jgi:hypothetical protein
MWSSHLVIGSGRSPGDHVTRDCADTCCHRHEIPASPSSRWYQRSRLDVTFLLPTPPNPVSGGWFWWFVPLTQRHWHSGSCDVGGLAACLTARCCCFPLQYVISLHWKCTLETVLLIGRVWRPVTWCWDWVKSDLGCRGMWRCTVPLFHYSTCE